MDRGEPIDFRKFYVDNVADFCDLREDYIGLVQKKVNPSQPNNLHMYSTCTVHVLYMYSTCTVQYMYCTLRFILFCKINVANL